MATKQLFVLTLPAVIFNCNDRERQRWVWTRTTQTFILSMEPASVEENVITAPEVVPNILTRHCLL